MEGSVLAAMRSELLNGPGRGGGSGSGRLALNGGKATGGQIGGWSLEDGQVLAVVTKWRRGTCIPGGDGGYEGFGAYDGAWRHVDVRLSGRRIGQ